MINNIGWSLVLTLFCLDIPAQNDTLAAESKAPTSFLVQSMLPTTLIFAGIFLNNSPIEIAWQREIRDEVGNDFHTPIDDYIQYVPFAATYAADLAGLSSKNHWFDQTKNMLFSTLATSVIIHSLKRIIGKRRPYGGPHSFPSGHTSTAFTGATILYREFKESSPLLAYSGFLFSTATGSLRVVNNRHWVSDVLAGAGISILVVNTIYYFEPFKNWNPFLKNKSLSFSPMIMSDGLLITAKLQF